ncbi:hypothetical protein ACRRTK_020180 [Alexandromys fortis]
MDVHVKKTLRTRSYSLSPSTGSQSYHRSVDLGYSLSRCMNPSGLVITFLGSQFLAQLIGADEVRDYVSWCKMPAASMGLCALHHNYLAGFYPFPTTTLCPVFLSSPSQFLLDYTCSTRSHKASQQDYLLAVLLTWQQNEGPRKTRDGEKRHTALLMKLLQRFARSSCLLSTIPNRHRCCSALPEAATGMQIHTCQLRTNRSCQRYRKSSGLFEELASWTISANPAQISYTLARLLRVAFYKGGKSKSLVASAVLSIWKGGAQEVLVVLVVLLEVVCRGAKRKMGYVPCQQIRNKAAKEEYEQGPYLFQKTDDMTPTNFVSLIKPYNWMKNGRSFLCLPGSDTVIRRWTSIGTLAWRGEFLIDQLKLNKDQWEEGFKYGNADPCQMLKDSYYGRPKDCSGPQRQLLFTSGWGSRKTTLNFVRASRENPTLGCFRKKPYVGEQTTMLLCGCEKTTCSSKVAVGKMSREEYRVDERI